MEHKQPLFMDDSEIQPPPMPEGSRSSRSAIIVVLAIIGIVATLFTIKLMRDAPLAGAGGPGGPPMGMPPAAVFVEAVAQENAQAEATATGSLRAVSEAEIAARESGAVIEVLVDEGDVIAKGAAIARLDTRRVAAQIAEAQAALASARGMATQRMAELERAKTDLTMKSGLLDTRAVSKSDVLDAERTLAVGAALNDTAKDGIAEAASRLKFLEVQLEDLTITAPFDGVIVDRGVEPGEWVAAGAVVVSLVTVDPIEAWLKVPSRYLDDLSADTENFRVRRSASGQLIDPAKVDIIPRVEPLSQLFTVVATLPNANRRLAPGESVTGLIPVGKLEPHWRFSTDALIRSASGVFVYVVENPKKEGELPGARRVPVEIAFERDNQAYVKVSSDAFADGDHIIVEGNERLMPGQSLMVKSREEAMSPPSPEPAQ
jgi:RND family efflux transporter MFP subunit